MFGMNNKELMWVAVGGAALLYLWCKSAAKTKQDAQNAAQAPVLCNIGG